MKNILITESQFESLINNIINEQTEKEILKQLKLKHKMQKWFVENVLDNIEKVYPNNSDWIYYIDKNTEYQYMEYNIETKILYITYEPIYSYFRENYSTDSKEIRELIKHLVGEYMGIWILTVILV